MEQAGIDREKLDEVRSDVKVDFRSGEDDRKGSSACFAYVVGYASGFIIYIILIVFGMSLCGVMEEKVNRICFSDHIQR